MYEPKVNDYVLWKQSVGDDIEGWIYFKCSDYITIEINVKPKPEEDFAHSRFHKNERTLILCYNKSWKNLKFVKSRKSVYDEVNWAT